MPNSPLWKQQEDVRNGLKNVAFAFAESHDNHQPDWPGEIELLLYAQRPAMLRSRLKVVLHEENVGEDIERQLAQAGVADNGENQEAIEGRVDFEAFAYPEPV